MSGSAFVSILIMVVALGYAFSKYRSRSFSMSVLSKSLAFPFMIMTAMDPTSVDFTVVLLMLATMLLTGPGILTVNKMNGVRNMKKNVEATGKAAAKTAKEVTQEEHVSKSAAAKRTVTKGAENLHSEMEDTDTGIAQGVQAGGEAVKQHKAQQADQSGWLQEDVLRLQNDCETPAVARIGIRRGDQTVFKQRVELPPGETKEWTDVPMNPPFEIGVAIGEDVYTADFRASDGFEVEATVTPEGVDIANVSDLSANHAGQQSSVAQSPDADTARESSASKGTPQEPAASGVDEDPKNTVTHAEPQQTEAESGGGGLKYVAPFAGNMVSIAGVPIPGLPEILSLGGIVGGLGLCGVGVYRFLS